MMFTILVEDDNTLVTSIFERIMQRSKLVDNIHFLVPTTYKEFDMSPFTVIMEYILPVSRELHSVELIKSNELYKEMLEYKIPADTNITSEAGDIEVQLSFVNVVMQDNGSGVQYVRKTSATKIHIASISDWSNIIPDNALTAIDQRIVALDTTMRAMDALAQETYENKADNLVYENSKLQLMANGNKIGDAITINESETADNPDGNLRVVVF